MTASSIRTSARLGERLRPPRRSRSPGSTPRRSSGRRRSFARAGTGTLVTYSPKVFIPLTKLCRDVCHYCTFAQPPRRGERAYMTADEVLDDRPAGAAAGCHEALFTLGDKPELRYRAAREELAALGFETTIEYLAHVAAVVLEETGLLPHANPGVMTRDELAAPARGLRLAGDHARERRPTALRARRPALRLPRQASRPPGSRRFGSPASSPSRSRPES